ncbi:hypothetical protein [Streptomyces sp. NPDC057557]|uniref:hypothetical protein n=1 Tax=Streptomyces sp. NPDC057557 TaxID=3346167 RepID=UPI0036B008CF
MGEDPGLEGREDDGGTAIASPQYGVRVQDARDVTAIGAYLHGLTAGVFRAGTNTRIKLLGCTAVAGNNYTEDRVQN